MQEKPTPTRQQRRARERERQTKRATENKQMAKIVGGRIDGRTFDQWPGWEGHAIPTRENCDLANPRQAFLWMFVAMPGMQGAPLMLPPDYWEMQSWRMWMLGARPAAEPTLKWQAPVSLTANPHMAAGKWVDPATPEPERKTIAEMFRELPQKERAEVRAAVLESLGIDDGDKPAPPAVQYTVADLAERLNADVDELITTLGHLGVTNVHAGSRISREVAERITAHMGL